MGTRVCVPLLVRSVWDHPHAYGDKVKKMKENYVFLGSSPRVWGQVRSLHRDNAVVRIIPTRMGTRERRTINGRFFKDHPHAYGDKSLTHSGKDPSAGSSPRVWGQVLVHPSSCAYGRIIPTRMGTSALIPSSPPMYKDHPHAYGDK